MAKKNEKVSLEEIIANPEALSQQLGKVQSFTEKYRNIIVGMLGGLALLVGGYLFWGWYNESQDNEAQDKLFRAVRLFESDSTGRALKEFERVIEDFSYTPAGNQARFYAGICALREGKFDKAIEHLSGFSSNDLIIQASVYARIGDAYMEKKQYDDAISYYDKAANYKTNNFTTPGYLVKLGVAYEEAKKNEEAIETYASIIEQYEQSAEAATAKKYKSKLEGAASE
jgi:tetratricopeptide (TPR) repeat protein